MSEPTEPRRPKGSHQASQDPSATAPQAADQPGVDQQAADQQATEPHGVDPLTTGAVPTPTQPLPTTGAVPGIAEAVPAGHSPTGAPSGHAGGSPSGPPSGPPPGFPPGPSAGGPVGPPPKRPGLWRQATSTTGGLIAVVVAGALSALLVLGVVGTIGLVALRAAGHDRNDRIERVGEDGGRGLPPGQQRKLDRMPQGPDRKGGQGNGQDNRLPGQGDDNGIPEPGDGMGPGNGMGGLMRGAMGLGDVQHGEFTVQQDGKTVVMTLQRGAVTKASATSVTVKSDDAFTATYVLDQDTRGRAGALAVGDEVLVVAEKTGAKAVMVTRGRKG